MERYWSPVVILQKSPVATVADTRDFRPEICLARVSVRLFIIPLPVSAPPKVDAVIIRKIVANIPVIPLVWIRLSRVSLPVYMDVDPNVVVIIPRKYPSKPSAPPISNSKSGCAMIAVIPAVKEARNSVAMAGIFLAIRKPVMTGTMISHGDMLKGF